MSDEAEDQTPKSERTLPSTKPPETEPKSPPVFTPQDFAKVLAGDFEALRKDFSAQVGSVATMLEESVMARLDRHMEREERAQKEMVSTLHQMKGDLSQVVTNYHRVNRDVGEHTQRISVLEGELHSLKGRVEEVMQELKQLKDVMVE